ncbi:MAG: hypothetical protein MSC31_17125 [Solirubrobacteraceae bacterium MAG38_C4-C5]|nr:hypothetical protein [Candidatus Siliceabacter maunaloa]
MRSYVNPFRSRTSEQVAHQGLDRYLRTFGADALDLLPDELWERPLVIRSAPGAGKTSLLRAVSADALRVLALRRSGHEELIGRLQAMGALDDHSQPLVLGFRVPLVRDFRGIIDLETEPAAAQRTFLRLLDARIIGAFCDAIELLVDVDEGPVLDAVTVKPERAGEASLGRLGGKQTADLRRWARQTEEEILDRLDAVLPRDDRLDGHAALYSLRALSGIELLVDGKPSPLRPLLLLDDGQELAGAQRTLLLDALHDRELRLARWYTERYSALEPEDLVGDGEPRRNSEPVWLEREARRMGAGTRRGLRTRQYERLLADIAGRRANALLREYDDEDREFVQMLDVDGGTELVPRAERAVAAIRGRLLAQSSGSERYATWFADADGLVPLESARRWRELEIVIARDRDRSELGLFELQLSDEERTARSDAAIREAADLWLRREFGLPFYWGSQRLGKLSAENIEQYLNLSADMFDEMLAGITLRQGAAISRLRQDAALTAACDQFWADIPDRRIGGRAIQQLLRHVAKLCRAETYRPKAPYAPGVTGTALSMDDRARLLDPDVRARMPGAQQLFEALHGAIGHNLLRAFKNRSVKNDRWMVLYLNRLTCVRYGLPLGYGGFREKPLEEMCRWMLADTEDATEPAVQESLDLV